ncbi:OsmC-like family protein [Limosilactobacillus frumenti DSM 13145]|uniref:OsmC-like family protein n=1 Tax=Limosilactobacillus frumenti DSM 13145 TaxID=1423746 RepID=A0A0R1P8A1_9LACO|nr:OsmC family protein [Limosilactobacillus frumenti]KRL28492.1 OsmC-like family protein [Limosilactobacillus frumenti DSM 13145]MBA2914743.1 OsmC family protein [Limosilactobacillus frumenti]QFG72110.1 OsmC family protein [Limosilactobacillus frumenti]
MDKYKVTARKTALRLQSDVHARGLHTMIDEPVKAGGNNTGMNPMELLLATLGASLQETAAKLARQQNFTYDHLTVNVEGDLDKRGFMGVSGIRSGFQEIRVNFIINSSEDVKTCQHFIKTVEQQSPIYDTLTKGTTVIRDQVVKD